MSTREFSTLLVSQKVKLMMNGGFSIQALKSTFPHTMEQSSTIWIVLDLM